MAVSGPTAAGPTGPTPDPDRLARGHSIRAELSRLVLAALLPAFLFAAAAGFSAYRARRMAAELDLMQNARAVSAALDAEFARKQALLQGLASSPALAAGDMRAFHQEARAASASEPVGLSDAGTGRQVLSTNVPWEQPLPAMRDDYAWIADAVLNRMPQVKNVRWSPVRGAYNVSVQVPVLVHGRVAYVLHSGVSSDELGRVIRHFRFPGAWLVVVTDRRGVRAARSRENRHYVGEPMTPAIRDRILARREGVSRNPNAEGKLMVDAIARSPLTGYSVVVGVPAAAFTASLVQGAAWVSLSGLAAGILGLALAGWMARRISRPLGAAAEAARSIGRGVGVEPRTSGITEIDVISGALADASRALALRSAERDRQEAELSGHAFDLEARVKTRTAALDAANRALGESEKRMRAVFDSTFQMSGLATVDGRVVAANRAALEAVDATEDQVIGKLLWDTPWWAGTPQVREQLPEAFEAVKSGEFLRTEVRVNLPHGPRIFDYSMRPLYLYGGARPDHVLIEGRDITELKAAQERADRSQRMEALGLLTGGVAHDFNNILTVIKGAIEVALKGPIDPRAWRLLKAALEASDRGEQLNKQLLGFARRGPVTQVSLNVADVVERMEPLLRNAVGAARQLELEMIRPDGDCVVEAAQFETALLNLVVNARDATPEGGMVKVSVHPATPAELRRLPAFDREVVSVEVSDTGRGIAPEHLGRVFDPFFTTKPAGEGTGLGLSQVYGFVRQSGGHIDVESEVNQGTRVTLALPLVPAAVRVEAPEPAPAPVAPLKVLLVEDDPLVIDVSEAMLRDLGHEVTPTRNAREALKALETGEFDLMFADVIMPEGVNGVQLAHRAQALRPALKVLLCSGWTENALSEAGPAGAPWPLLHKPFSSEGLERALTEATGPTGRRADG